MIYNDFALKTMVVFHSYVHFFFFITRRTPVQGGMTKRSSTCVGWLAALDADLRFFDLEKRLPLWKVNIAINNDPFTMNFQSDNGDFPYFR